MNKLFMKKNIIVFVVMIFFNGLVVYASPFFDKVSQINTPIVDNTIIIDENAKKICDGYSNDTHTYIVYDLENDIPKYLVQKKNGDRAKICDFNLNEIKESYSIYSADKNSSHSMDVGYNFKTYKNYFIYYESSRFHIIDMTSGKEIKVIDGYNAINVCNGNIIFSDYAYNSKERENRNKMLICDNNFNEIKKYDNYIYGGIEKIDDKNYIRLCIFVNIVGKDEEDEKYYNILNENCELISPYPVKNVNGKNEGVIDVIKTTAKDFKVWEEKNGAFYIIEDEKGYIVQDSNMNNITKYYKNPIYIVSDYDTIENTIFVVDDEKKQIIINYKGEEIFRYEKKYAFEVCGNGYFQIVNDEKTDLYHISNNHKIYSFDKPYAHIESKIVNNKKYFMVKYNDDDDFLRIRIMNDKFAIIYNDTGELFKKVGDYIIYNDSFETFILNRNMKLYKKLSKTYIDVLCFEYEGKKVYYAGYNKKNDRYSSDIYAYDVYDENFVIKCNCVDLHSVSRNFLENGYVLDEYKDMVRNIYDFSFENKININISDAIISSMYNIKEKKYYKIGKYESGKYIYDIYEGLNKKEIFSDEKIKYISFDEIKNKILVTTDNKSYLLNENLNVEKKYNKEIYLEGKMDQMNDDIYYDNDECCMRYDWKLNDALYEDKMYDYNEDYVFFYDDNSKNGVMDLDGNILVEDIQFIYEKHKNYFLYEDAKEKKFGIMDYNGRVIESYDYDEKNE